jgi:hypothetical protein
MRSSPTPSACRPSRWAVRSCCSVDTRAYPTNSSFIPLPDDAAWRQGQSVPGLPPTASNSPAAAVCQPRCSSSTEVPATDAELTPTNSPVCWAVPGCLLTGSSTGHCVVPNHGCDSGDLFAHELLPDRQDGGQRRAVNGEPGRPNWRPMGARMRVDLRTALINYIARSLPETGGSRPDYTLDSEEPHCRPRRARPPRRPARDIERD